MDTRGCKHVNTLMDMHHVLRTLQFVHTSASRNTLNKEEMALKDSSLTISYEATVAF
jgi:hypothetical protein